MFGLLLLGWVIFIILDVTNSSIIYSFKDNCSYCVHHLQSSELAFINYNYDILPSDTCSIGFYSNKSDHRICVDALSYSIQDCRLLLEFNDTHHARQISTCDVAKPKQFCTSRILVISLHNADLYTNGRFSLKIYTVRNTAHQDEGGSNTHWIILGVVVFVVVCSGGGGNSAFRKNRNTQRPRPNPATRTVLNTHTQGHSNLACNVDDESQPHVQDAVASAVVLDEIPNSKYDPPAYDQLPLPSAPSGGIHTSTYNENSTTSNDRNSNRSAISEVEPTRNLDDNARTLSSQDNLFVVMPAGQAHNSLPSEDPPRYEDIFFKTPDSNI